MNKGNNALKLPAELRKELTPGELEVYEYLLMIHFFEPESDGVEAKIIAKDLNQLAAGLNYRHDIERYEAWAYPRCKKLVKRGLIVCTNEKKKTFKVEMPIGVPVDPNSKEGKDYYDAHIQPHMDTIKALAMKGEPIAEISKKIGANTHSLYYAAYTYPLLRTTLTESLVKTGSRVELSLVDRALGYFYDEVKTKETINAEGKVVATEKTTIKKHVPGEIGAMKFWLMNRMRNEWKRSDHISNVIGKLSITALLGEVTEKEEEKNKIPLDPSKEVPMKQIVEGKT